PPENTTDGKSEPARKDGLEVVPESVDAAHAVEIGGPAAVGKGRASGETDRSAASGRGSGVILSRVYLVLAAVVTGTLAGGLSYLVLSPPVLPKVIRTTQITHDGRSKWQGYEGPLLLTDGSRIYFVEMENDSTRFALAQIPVSGGETSLIPS